MNSNIISQNHSGNSDQKLTYNSRNHRESSRYETLKEAILHKDRGTIVWLINEGCPVNDDQVDLVARSDTPLHLAVFTNDFHTVGILLSAGAKVNSVNFHKQTPLHLAFEMGNMRMVDLLLSECTDGRVNPFTSYGLSHFHIACVRNNWRIVGSYLESGVNANVYLEKSFYGKDYVYYRPLHLAVLYQNLEVAELLLKYGANVNAKDRYKRTPLHLACSYNHRRICEAIRDPDLAENSRDVLNRIRAENHVQVDIVNLLISYEADVNALDSNGMPPLVHVFKCNYREIKNTIRGKVNTEDENFWKEAIEVFRDVQRRKFYLLLQHGVNARFCNDTKDTLLHLVIDGRKLFSNGSHAVVPKEQGLCDEEKAEIVDLLLTSGTDVEAKNSRGQTALQMAISMYQVKTVKILLKRQAWVKNICFFHYKIPKRVPGGSYDLSDVENFLEIVSLILKKKFDLNLNRINELLVLRYMDTETSIQLFENCSTSDLRHLLDFGDINTMDLSSYICERTVLTNREKISLILQHIQKLEVAGLYVNDYIKGEFLKYHCIIDAKQNGSDQAFVDLCKDEINKLKEIMIDRYASFYDLLFLNVNEVAVRVKNSHFRNSVRKNCNLNFTIYNDIIIKQFVKGLVRSILLSLAKEYLSILIGLEFPDPCSESIISYLTNEDLCNLALAFE